MLESIKLIECPRDAIQGLHDFIPTEKKAAYLNYLLSLEVFDTLDFGSFVSASAIPQMADTKSVLRRLKKSKTKLLSIIANLRGAKEALTFSEIDYLGFPFSISETFQIRNTNATVAEAFDTVKRIQELCLNADRQLVLYLSMAFGNPYNDVWNTGLVLDWFEKMRGEGIKIISLADTTGSANLESIATLCKDTIPVYEDIEVGLHLHTKREDSFAKIKIASEYGCKRFDGAILGYGGCPMAKDELVGNMPMEQLLTYFEKSSNQDIEEMKAKFNEMIV